MRNTYEKWGKLVCVYTYIHIFVKKKKKRKKKKRKKERKKANRQTYRRKLFFCFIIEKNMTS